RRVGRGGCAAPPGVRHGPPRPRRGGALAAGRLLARAGHAARARAHREVAAGALGASTARDDALARLAALHKGAGRRDLAEPLWRELAACPGPGALRAHVELAMYYEHHARDLPSAASVVEAALRHLESGMGRHDPGGAARWRSALLWRRARVHSKLERP
ncbi:MAG TPA: hypothetical protein VFG74_17165, partial [Miltoncostaeaceae bacterium]|nr:hypothetical protein [Miltoncostaeaceae bacterium]